MLVALIKKILFQQLHISNESTRYAQSRYLLPPFVLRFRAKKISIKQVKEDILYPCKNVYQMDIQLLNCRLSSAILDSNAYDVLVYVKDAISFCFLIDQAHWPSMLDNENFIFPSTLVIPPQLCVLIKNVDIRLDFEDFCNEIHAN